MKKFLLIILIIIPSSIFAGGLTTIQAVCKVKLKTGESIEGYITYAYGGFNSFYAPNGFCVKESDSIKSSYLFSLGRVIGVGQELLNNSPEAKMYFIKNISYENVEYYQKYNYSSKENSLQIEYRNIYKFKLLDSLEIYNELVDLNLFHQKEHCIKISTKDIEHFEILDNPSDKMLKEIESKRKIFNSKTSDYGDTIEPLWFHEIMKDRELFLRLLKYFLYD